MTDLKIEMNYIICKYNDPSFNSNTKVAGFDLDHTIIKPIKGKRFSKTDTDWEFYDNTIVDKLKKYHQLGYQIIIITNQKILKKDIDKKYWISKTKKINKILKIPLLFVASLKDDNFRKPRTGSWDKFIKCDKKYSFYCGDAGGLGVRKIDNHSLKKDFSDSDLKFSLNVGIRFIHRDEFIYGKVWNDLKPSYPIIFDSIKKGKYNKLSFKEKEMIIVVGYPGSGKSYFSKNAISPKYMYVNRDTLKTKNKCLKKCKEAIINKQSIIIDNTNPSVNSRKIFIDIGKEVGYKIKCINFTTSMDLAYHNNVYRHTINSKNNIVPKIAYNIFKSKYEKPTIEEGFDEIINQEFILDTNEVDILKYKKYMF